MKSRITKMLAFSPFDYTDSRLMHVFMIAGAIVGIVLSLQMGSESHSVLERIGYVLVGILVCGALPFVIFLAIGIPLSLGGALILTMMAWMKKRKMKSHAYWLLESVGFCDHHPDWFKKEVSEVVSGLEEQHGSREVRHLLNDLYELQRKLEQIPDKEEEAQV
jgi:uncharacterized membrane protein